MLGIPASGGFWRWKTRLHRLPSRRPVVRLLPPEDADSPFEVRHLLYGRRPHVYRVLFTIKGDKVTILHIRHGRRQAVSPH
jgi:hypothetical protein